MKYNVEYKKEIPKGFIGMNYKASKSLHIPFHHKHPEHTIEVKKSLPKKVRLHTIRHEEAESYFERVKHYSYEKAHRLALKYEKIEIPFPRTKIKEILKRAGIIKR